MAEIPGNSRKYMENQALTPKKKPEGFPVFVHQPEGGTICPTEAGSSQLFGAKQLNPASGFLGTNCQKPEGAGGFGPTVGIPTLRF